MKCDNPFASQGVWLRGNTHSHSTESDGQLTPAEIAESYAQHGYDFVILTDHWKRTASPATCPQYPLMISAQEVDFTIGKTMYHIVCLGAEHEIPCQEFSSLDELIDLAKQEGFELIVAHPYWLGIRSQQLIDVNPFMGIEVYNTICDSLVGKGYSSTIWDDLLDAGKQVWGFAADDLHTPDLGIAQGWVMVKSAEKTEAAIFEALRNGMFYSTQGPDICDLSVNEGKLCIKCSPVKRINLVCNRWYGEVRQSPAANLTEAAFDIPPKATYARVECIDADGKIAWSNPVFLD